MTTASPRSISGPLSRLAQTLPRHMLSAVGLTAAVCVGLAGPSTAHAATLPPGFSETFITGTITGGTVIEFAPDGKLFVLEQSGTCEVYSGSGGGTWTLLAVNFFQNTPLVTTNFFERGLLGIAFDPDYLNNRYVYVYYTFNSTPVRNRISRFTADANGSLALAGSEALIMDLDTVSAGNHNGGAIHFGPDGKLYVAVGENAVPSNAQNLNNRLGKMLRLNPIPVAEGDPIPSDNPTTFAGLGGPTTGNNRAIWAVGLRNPYTFAFKPGSSLMYINDVGQGTYEEVNVGAAGVNYGWPTTEGPFAQASFPNFTRPLIWYHRTNTALSSNPPGPQLSGFNGAAIIGGSFYLPANPIFPSTYIGDYFFGEYINDWIKRYDVATNTVTNFATGALGAVSMVTGPDGAFYYLSRDAVGGGRVFRVVYTGPLCEADLAPAGGPDGTVNVQDLLAVIGAWGPCGKGACPADVAPPGPPQGDDIVNVQDLLAVIGAWGACP